MSQARFQKRMWEKTRQHKAGAKRQRKEDRAAAAESPTDRDDAPTAPQSEVLSELADLHERFDDDDIEFDEFEERKHELLARLDV